MPRNVYFSQGTNSEQRIYEDIIIEGLRIYGHDVYYLPRKIIKEDGIFNEASLSEFGSSYMIEAYVENVDAFEGEGDLLSKFGLEIRDQATLVISNKRWEQLVGRFQNPVEARPQEGDIIYFPLVNTLFEIKYVEQETPFYQLQNLPVFKLKIEAFEYGNEAIDTGVEEIDAFESQFGARTRLITSATTEFAVGDNVTQSQAGLTINGEIAELIGDNVTAPVGSIIDVTGISADDNSNSNFKVTNGSNGNLVNVASGAVTPILSIDTFEPIKASDTYQTDQSSEFEDIGNNFIDFSELNPFGIPDNA
jgi:hypothetical protein